MRIIMAFLCLGIKFSCFVAIFSDSSAALVSACIKGKTVGIVNALVSMGVDSSFAHRTKLAVTNGVVTTASEYKGTPAQNTALLKLLKQGKLMKA